MMSVERGRGREDVFQSIDTGTMSDLRQYTKRFIMEFIEIYKSHPALWQIKNKDYRDKAKKAAAYETLVKKCKEVEPYCDKEIVVKKINSLRTCYRKEYKKVQRSLSDGNGEVYKPRLWYFDLLSFLNEDSTISSDSTSFLYADEEITNDYLGIQCDPLTSQSESMSESGRSSPAASFMSKKRQRRDEVDENCAMQRKAEDEFDLLGKIYAGKLRKLSREQRIFAEKIINDTLFEAEFGNLNRGCKLVIVENRKSIIGHTLVDLKAEYSGDDADTSFVD